MKTLNNLNKEQFTAKIKEKRAEIIAAGRAVFACMAFVDTIRPVVEGYQREILATIKGRISEKHRIRGREDEIIIDPDDSWLMEDKDFQEYIDECHIEAQKHGFNVPEKGYCPLLMAKNNLRKARQILVEVMEPITGIKYDDLFHHGMTDYENYIELTLKLIAGMATKKELNVLKH